jgi:hypothetical protein
MESAPGALWSAPPQSDLAPPDLRSITDRVISVLGGAFGFVHRLGGLPDLLGEVPGDGSQLLGRFVFAMELDMPGESDREHGFEHRLGPEAPLDEVDSNGLPVVRQLLSDLGQIFDHQQCLSDPVRWVVGGHAHTCSVVGRTGRGLAQKKAPQPEVRTEVLKKPGAWGALRRVSLCNVPEASWFRRQLGLF